jgi:hypothetical protein
MDRRHFLKSGLGAGLAASLGGYSLFPSDLHAKIPANLKVTKLKVIPVWTGSMNYIFVKLYTNAGRRR